MQKYQVGITTGITIFGTNLTGIVFPYTFIEPPDR